jgi:hypothetical protein
VIVVVMVELVDVEEVEAERACASCWRTCAGRQSQCPTAPGRRLSTSHEGKRVAQVMLLGLRFEEAMSDEENVNLRRVGALEKREPNRA